MKKLLYFMVPILLLTKFPSVSEACYWHYCIEVKCGEKTTKFIICKLKKKTGFDYVDCWEEFEKPEYVEGECLLKMECEKCPKCYIPECTCPPCVQKPCPECFCPEQEKCEKPNDAGPTEADDGKALAGGCNINSDMSLLTSLLSIGMLIMLFALFRWHGKKKKIEGVWHSKLWWIGVIIILSCMFFVVVLINTANAYPTQTLNPVPGEHDYIATQDSRISLPSVKLFWHYEKQPLTIIHKPSNRLLDTVIKDRNTLHFMGILPLGENTQLSFNLPAILDQTEGNIDNLNGGVGDLSLGFKGKFYEHEFFELGVLLDLSFPTATAMFYGEEYGSLTIKAIVSSRPLNWLDLSTNAGFKFRDTEKFTEPGYQNHEFGQLFVASSAARFKIIQEKEFGLNLLTDLNFALTMDSVTQEEVPLEWFNAFEIKLPYGFQLVTGIGAGLTRGVGTPDYRLFAGLSWVHQKCKMCTQKTLTKIEYRTKPCPKVIKNAIMIPNIYFDTDKSTLRPRSIEILNNVVKLLKQNPGVKKLHLSGHCDPRAPDKYNMKLSKRRVMAAVSYLVSKGVSVKKLVPKYFGERHRNNFTDTEDGWQLNRRVEMVVIELR